MSESFPLVSARARRLLEQPPLAPYLYAHFGQLDSVYDAEARPDGYIGLCVAENRLMWSEMSARMAAVPEAPHRVLGYDAMIGARPFRERLAAFLSQWVMARPISAEAVAVLAGAGSVLELLFYALGDPGDAVLVPTPSYAGFWPDLETRDALRIVTVPTTSADGFMLTVDKLEAARAASPHPVRALLFTTPDNPLGRVYTRAQLEAVVSWADAAGIHVVFDEVYALSIFGSTPFTSAASVLPSLGDRVHLVWAFSKDFGASGLRCGVLVTENEEVRRSVDALAYWSACSGHTQYVLGELVSDAAWVDGYLRTQQERLRSTYAAVTERLAHHGIAFVPAEGGIFVLVDLRTYLDAPAFEAEGRLWRRIVDEANVNLTPGSACRVAEPGFFRLCWASLPVATVRAGIDRVASVLSR